VAVIYINDTLTADPYTTLPDSTTGRLDRVGALTEHAGLPIEVHEPYLAGTQDEKMFRVVKDRAGWFDVVMGRPVGMDERVTDREEQRVPLAVMPREVVPRFAVSRSDR